MGFCRRRCRPHARAGSNTVFSLKPIQLAKRKGPLAVSGVPTYFAIPRSRSAARGGKQVFLNAEVFFPMSISVSRHRKLDVYDLCLMIDLAADQE